MRMRTTLTATLTAGALTMGALAAGAGVAGAQADDPTTDRAGRIEELRGELGARRCEWLGTRIAHLEEATATLPQAVTDVTDLRDLAAEAGRDDLVETLDALLERLDGADERVAERIATLTERQAEVCAPAA